jgi:hypothetical protein
MIRVRFFLLCFSLFFFQNCEKKVPTPTAPFHAEFLNSNAKPVDISVFQMNSWVENEKYYVVGICNNNTADWQKMWVELQPVDGEGKPITISKCTSVIVPTYSDAVPPSGRSSFAASWPLSDFSGKPASCSVKSVKAIQPVPGPILVSQGTMAMVMMTPGAQGEPASVEQAWQVSGTISNPLPLTASNPMLEVLVFSQDGKLWLSTVINPTDPATSGIFHFDRQGPFQPKEDRNFSLQVAYAILPKPIQQQKIGRVEILPFEARK